VYLCRSRKHNCQPFCGPEGWSDCSDSVCSLWPAPLSYLCTRVRILGVLKTVCCCTVNPDCCPPPAVVSIFTDSAACVLSFYAPPPHYIKNKQKTTKCTKTTTPKTKQKTFTNGKNSHLSSSLYAGTMTDRSILGGSEMLGNGSLLFFFFGSVKNFSLSCRWRFG